MAAVLSPATFCVALLLLVAGVVHAVPESGSGGSTATCSTDLFRLLPCLSFIDGSAAAPADTCCSNLGSMVHDEPQCLCQAIANPGASPVPVNITRVFAMPRLCRLDLPSAAGACAVSGLLPHGPASPPPPAAIARNASANSTVPSTVEPASRTPARTPVMTPSPWVSGQMPRYSKGSKAIVDGFSVALGFVALLSILGF